MANFPDWKYIETIRQALWNGSEFGRAAVMVGSGFSRNAEPVGVQVARFPLWGDLVTQLVIRLYPPARQSANERDRMVQRASVTSGALRMAEEFESAFGRQKLDELLLEAIPDHNFRPGRMHRLLLDLPWVDVLTTNYDTLLERSAQTLVGRRYSAVRTVDEIPLAMRPRITKLHGTFPAHRPFILTEEDFRTYPRRFAAFVNLAQQTFMENVICLLGFSGDDPNFLHWTGWVRDNLGDSAPWIYLCGLLDLNDSQRRLLYRRNVTPVDLTPLFPKDEFPDADERQRLAIEWLLLSIEAGKPPDPLDWPSVPGPLSERSPRLPEILPPRHDAPQKETFQP
jgi:hypothetical protein